MTQPPPAWRNLQSSHIDSSGAHSPTHADTIEEVPIAFSYGGVAHAVMMATPTDLEDFAVGFSITEAIATAPADIRQIDTVTTDEGIHLDITLVPTQFSAFLSRRRMRSLRGHTSCGLCGVEDLADIERPATPLPPTPLIASAAIRAALGDLRRYQPLSQRTHAAHAAAWADSDGKIVLLREDVGRHSALDKLIGACLRTQTDIQAGFCLVTSRCSYEMVQKAVAARIGTFVAVSAPTALAIRYAEASGLNLVARATPNDQQLYSGLIGP